MSENSFKSIRNGVIASVIGGVFLWVVPTMRGYVISFLSWFWSGVVWCWEALIASYSLQGWIWLLIFILALKGLISIIPYPNLKENPEEPEEPEFKSYTEDFMQGVKWRWGWSGNQISNVWCYCSCCDAMLVYIDKHIRDDMFYDSGKTDFICEHCNHNVVTSIVGDKNYVINLIKREIGRRIRTGEYKK